MPENWNRLEDIALQHSKNNVIISDAQYYILVKLISTVGSIHLFKITGKLTPKHVKLKETYYGISEK